MRCNLPKAWPVINAGASKAWMNCIRCGFGPSMFLRDMGVELERLAAIAEELMFLIETRFYHRAMRPEMPAVLEAIKQMGLKIGLISNVNSRGQVPANLKAYGIIHYFDPIVLSSEYGRRKPDPAIFHYAARLANVPPAHVSMSATASPGISTGRARRVSAKRSRSGMTSSTGKRMKGATPDAVIDNMTELLDLLRADRGPLRPIRR